MRDVVVSVLGIVVRYCKTLLFGVTMRVTYYILLKVTHSVTSYFLPKLVMHMICWLKVWQHLRQQFCINSRYRLWFARDIWRYRNVFWLIDWLWLAKTTETFHSCFGQNKKFKNCFVSFELRWLALCIILLHTLGDKGDFSAKKTAENRRHQPCVAFIWEISSSSTKYLKQN